MIRKNINWIGDGQDSGCEEQSEAAGICKRFDCGRKRSFKRNTKETGEDEKRNGEKAV